MKKNKSKSLLMMAMITVLLTAAIGGTIAWIVDYTDPVTNVFTPSKVDTEIEETMEDGVKKKIVITNTVSEENGGIPVYVRVAVSGNYIDDETGAIVASWTPNFTVGTGWIQIGNYYYYQTPVAPDDSTSNLLGSVISPDLTTHKDAHLEVVVMHQSIQAKPETVVETEWSVTVESEKITGSN